MSKHAAFLVAAAATFAAGFLTGCADVRIRVVGDRPADILITQDLPSNRGDPKYIGRVDSGGSRAAGESSAESAPFAYEYLIPEQLRSYGLLVVVRTKDGDWTYPVDPAFVKAGGEITLRYPPADSSVPAARVPQLPAQAAPAPTEHAAAAKPLPAGSR